MIIGLFIILLLTLVLPFTMRAVEHNLEIFLFIMGILAVFISKSMSLELIEHIFRNHFMYMITAAVLFISLLFKAIKDKVKSIMEHILEHIPLRLVVFLMVIVLGLVSSFITAIVASLLLVEVVSVLPMERKNKVTINIISCFSIGIGAALTPVGEPITTIVVTKLGVPFGFMFSLIGQYVIVGIIALAILAAFFANHKDNNKNRFRRIRGEKNLDIRGVNDEYWAREHESYSDIALRTVKIFIFIIALELLGTGFQPIIDKYVVNLDTHVLYIGNMVSAILDNATLAAAEISNHMTNAQIRSLLLGLLISGGMLIPGNIPNIITAGKLKIKSSEWMKIGLPIGVVMLLAYYIVLFII